MSRSRGRKLKSLVAKQSEYSDVFFMSLDEAKRAIGEQYEFLADRYEGKLLKKKTA